MKLKVHGVRHDINMSWRQESIDGISWAWQQYVKGDVGTCGYSEWPKIIEIDNINVYVWQRVHVSI